MKLTIDRSALLAALTPCVSVTSTKAVSKHGSLLLLHATNESTGGRCLTIRASRDFTSVRAHAEADVATPGSICVPAEEFAKRVQLMPDGPIALSVSGSKLTIKHGKSKHELRTLPASDFPAFPSIDADAVRVDGKALASLIDATSFATEENNPRGVKFDGVVFASRGNHLVASSFDGLGCLAWAKVPHEGGAIDTFATTAALDVVRASVSEFVSIASSHRTVCFTMGRVELAYQKPDLGDFQYEALVAQIAANDGGVTVKRRDLAAKVKAVCPDGMSGSMPITVACEDGRIVLTNSNADESTDEIECAGAGRWSALVEAKYLRDAIRFGGDDVSLDTAEGTAKQPLILRSGCGVSCIMQCVPVAREEKAKVAA